MSESRTRQDFEAMCPHNPCDEVNPHPSPWVGPICLDCMNAIVGAAEERGRRRAETEQADLLLACEEALIWCSAADAFKPDGIAALGWQRVVLPVLERVRVTRKSLAPRDSGKELDAGGAVNETATKHAHDLFEKWPQLRDLSLNALTAELGAAEERGRRRGVEEAATLCDHRANGHDVGSAAGLEARKCANAVRDLAPRDSAPVCDAVLSSDPFREWRCGKPQDHEGPHSGEAPRDSGKDEHD